MLGLVWEGEHGCRQQKKKWGQPVAVSTHPQKHIAPPRQDSNIAERAGATGFSYRGLEAAGDEPVLHSLDRPSVVRG